MDTPIQRIYSTTYFPNEIVNHFYDLVEFIHNMIFIEKRNSATNQPYMLNPSHQIQEAHEYEDDSTGMKEMRYKYVVDHDIGPDNRAKFTILLFSTQLGRQPHNSPDPTRARFKIFDEFHNNGNLIEFNFYGQNWRPPIIDDMFKVKLTIWFNMDRVIPRSSDELNREYERKIHQFISDQRTRENDIQQRSLAFAMGSHHRLGPQNDIFSMSEIMQLILRQHELAFDREWYERNR